MSCDDERAPEAVDTFAHLGLAHAGLARGEDDEPRALEVHARRLERGEEPLCVRALIRAGEGEARADERVRGAGRRDGDGVAGVVLERARVRRALLSFPLEKEPVRRHVENDGARHACEPRLRRIGSSDVRRREEVGDRLRLCRRAGQRGELGVVEIARARLGARVGRTGCAVERGIAEHHCLRVGALLAGLDEELSPLVHEGRERNEVEVVVRRDDQPCVARPKVLRDRRDDEIVDLLRVRQDVSMIGEGPAQLAHRTTDRQRITEIDRDRLTRLVEDERDEADLLRREHRARGVARVIVDVLDERAVVRDRRLDRLDRDRLRLRTVERARRHELVADLVVLCLELRE